MVTTILSKKKFSEKFFKKNPKIENLKKSKESHFIELCRILSFLLVGYAFMRGKCLKSPKRGFILHLCIVIY